jgi:hypothetical protein
MTDQEFLLELANLLKRAGASICSYTPEIKGAKDFTIYNINNSHYRRRNDGINYIEVEL